MFYYTDIELKALESLKEKDLNAEQLAIVDKLAKGMKETICKASYDTEDVVNEVLNFLKMVETKRFMTLVKLKQKS